MVAETIKGLRFWQCWGCLERVSNGSFRPVDWIKNNSEGEYSGATEEVEAKRYLWFARNPELIFEISKVIHNGWRTTL